MERFDLSLWLQDKSRKVVTRDGREVRILDYNLKGDKRICIAVDDKTQESITTVDEDGHCLRDKTGWHESNFDLFFVGEEKDEFETTMISFSNAMFDRLLCINKEVNVKEWKNKLIDLARKEIRKEQQEKLGTLEMPIDVTEPYYIIGKEDTLKDLPKWKKCVGSTGPFIDYNSKDEAFLYLNDYVIKVSELEKLPKEE